MFVLKHNFTASWGHNFVGSFKTINIFVAILSGCKLLGTGNAQNP